MVVSNKSVVAAYKAKLRMEQQLSLITKYESKPAEWIEDIAKGFMWSIPRKIAQSIVENRRTAVPACHGLGKALSLDTPIIVPNGWKKMGDIQVGDKVYDEQGTICNVIAVSEIETRDTYRVYFNDDTFIDAADTHLWNVLDMSHRRRHVIDWRRWWSDTVIKTTKELFDNQRTNSNQPRWSVPNNKSLERAYSWLFRWTPYAYGCWIGDGHTNSWQMTCHKDDAQHFLLMTDGEFKEIPNSNCVQIFFPGQTNSDCPTKVYNKTEKFIPKEMLRTSTEDRLELLRGIMDTDGYLIADSTCVQVDLSVEALAMQVIELIRSLGWTARFNSRITKCTTTQRDGKRSYRVTFTPNENPFHLPRKALLWEARQSSKQTQFSRTTKKTITKIEYLGTREVKCIEVDAESKLYLAGKGMIPTHNSWLFGRIAVWWIASHPPGSAFVVTTAPSNRQVVAVLWKEIRRAWAAAKLPGRLNQKDWRINDELVALGYKPSDYDPTAFQGIHAKYCLVLLDEGCGIPENIYIAANSLASNQFSRLAVIGNPDDPDSHFAKICEPGSGWSVIHISAFDTPNFTGEYAPESVKENLVGTLYVEEMRQDVGEDSPVYVSKVLGQFPQNKEDGVIPLSFIRRCQNSDEYEEALQGNLVDLGPVEIGLDVGAGGDETCARVKYGKFLWPDLIEEKTPDPEDAYKLIVPFIMKHRARRIKIDIIGIGWGLAGMLRMCALRGLHHDELLGMDVDISYCEVIGVNVGQAATDSERFPRLRSQMWWEIGRELSRDGGWNLFALDEVTVGQLTRPTYKTDIANRIVVESKQDTMKRTSRPSPNRADALLLTFCEPPVEDEEHMVIVHDPVTIGPQI